MQIARKWFFLDFSGNFRVYTYIEVSFMRICKYLNQRVRGIGKQNRESCVFQKRVFQKKKKKKKTHEEIEFHNSI